MDYRSFFSLYKIALGVQTAPRTSARKDGPIQAPDGDKAKEDLQGY
jgi:hypothetical protein